MSLLPNDGSVAQAMNTTSREGPPRVGELIDGSYVRLNELENRLRVTLNRVHPRPESPAVGVDTLQEKQEYVSLHMMAARAQEAVDRCLMLMTELEEIL